MSKKRGQFSFTKKVTPNTGKGYLNARIRANKKLLQPPKLAGIGMKGPR